MQNSCEKWEFKAAKLVHLENSNEPVKDSVNTSIKALEFPLFNMQYELREICIKLEFKFSENNWQPLILPHFTSRSKRQQNRHNYVLRSKRKACFKGRKSQFCSRVLSFELSLGQCFVLSPRPSMMFLSL